MALTSCLRLCGPNVLNHFFCDISPLLRRCCSGTITVEMLDFVAALAVLATFLQWPWSPMPTSRPQC